MGKHSNYPIDRNECFVAPNSVRPRYAYIYSLALANLPRKPVTCFRRLKNIAESFTETDRNRFNT